MFDVHALRVFVTVAQNLSFTRAAEALFLTQSAVSHQISRMERDLGAVLFHRVGRRVELTRAGETLLSHSRRVFAAFDDAAASVKLADQPDAGELRIGASATACQFIVPEALREFRECFPNYALSITPGDSPAVTDMLIDGSIGIGLLIKSDRQSKLQFHPLFNDELGLVASPYHPISKIKKVRSQDLAAHKLVLYSRASSTWNLLERHFARLKLPMRDPIELGSIEAIKELVKLGLGIAVLARWVCEREIAEGSLVYLPMPGTKLTRQWCVGISAGRSPSVAEQTFINLCKAASKRLAHPGNAR